MTTTTFETGEEVVAALRERIPDFPDDFEARLGERLKDVFTHYQMQALIYACRLIVPDMPRAIFDDAATGHDLLAWMQNAAESKRAAFTPNRRGSYESADAALRPLVEQDITALYMSALDPATAHRWRFRGRTPAPDEFRRSLFGNGVLAQFMVVPRDDRTEGVGLVAAYSADLTAKHCYVAFQRADLGVGRSVSATRGLMIEGLLIFIAYLYDHFDFHKIYLEVPEYNQDLIGEAASVLKLEGRLGEHLYYGDKRWDQLLYALYRDTWDEISSLFRAAWDDGR